MHERLQSLSASPSSPDSGSVVDVGPDCDAIENWAPNEVLLSHDVDMDEKPEVLVVEVDE